MKYPRQRNTTRWIAAIVLTSALWTFAGCERAMDPQATPDWMTAARGSMEEELVRMYGEPSRGAAQRGLSQVAAFWRVQDGDEEVFRDFVLSNYAGSGDVRDQLFFRSQDLLEQLDGHMLEITRELRMQSDLDRGEILPFDEIMAGYDPSAHVTEDLFANKFAFTVLLNFPLTTLQERLEQGATWTRRQWAETRLAQRFSRRLPAEVNRAIAEASAAADQYIAEYNIWMHHLVDEQGRRLFPAGLRLLSHWNLRDEIKASYNDVEHGPQKQEMIQRVMERIILQEIPAVVVNNPYVDWNPVTNTVVAAAVSDAPGPVPEHLRISDRPEPDTRYAMLLKTFAASRQADPYSPTAPTLIARRFNEDREIPEERVRAMLEEVVSSPLVGRVAALIEQRLGRPLKPYDIWYNGFRPSGGPSASELDARVASRYPDPGAFQRDIPSLLMRLGFPAERARIIAGHIVVDPARGSGHAWGSAMRSAPARLRTRVGSGGMDYKGFNIAVHELGHNVEQVISLHDVDYTLLHGVPNTAFTEALAFVFQAQDLRLLGLATPDARAGALKTLNDFWQTYEIAGVALLDMAVWHWMYDHPGATPAQLKEATVRMARDLWNRYYAPVLKQEDVILLAIYSHMIHSFLYLPDYPIGHLIAHQVEERMKGAGAIGPEFDRMARIGRVAPDLWMTEATGRPVGAGALLAATEEALNQLGR
jgi:hypothetical protein